MRSLNAATAFTAPAPMFPSDTPAHSPAKREWTISDMARDFGVTLRALRFYESKGLIAPQRFGGARYYSARDRARLTMVLNAKRMGFTLAETAEMLGGTQENEVSDLPLSADTVESQIAFLENQRQAIDQALVSLRERQLAMRGIA
jgi:DNA-binding transcriptional MerR regulator